MMEVGGPKLVGVLLDSLQAFASYPRIQGGVGTLKWRERVQLPVAHSYSLCLAHRDAEEVVCALGERRELLQPVLSSSGRKVNPRNDVSSPISSQSHSVSTHTHSHFADAAIAEHLPQQRRNAWRPHVEERDEQALVARSHLQERHARGSFCAAEGGSPF